MAPTKKGSQCKKLDNPCKICLLSVNQKTGLQCSGACQTWVHYECVNFTPGKVKDIKDGIIRVTCPCPDCETRLPKEYRVDKPTCANQFCPANMPPHCEKDSCPTEVDPLHDSTNQTWPSVECGAECKKHMNDPHDPSPKPWPVAKCGAECKKHTQHDEPPPSPPPQSRPPPSRPPPSRPPASRPRPRARERDEVRGDCCVEAEGTPSFSVVGQMCSTIGLLAKQMNTLMSKMEDLTKSAGPKPESRPVSPEGCHKPSIAPCKDKKEADKCCCSKSNIKAPRPKPASRPESPGGCHNPPPCRDKSDADKCCCSKR